MAAWFIPALKVVLPHVATIISTATPVFTRKKSDAAAASQMQLLQQQITELQAAASQNAELIKELAAQLQSTVAALEQAASSGEAKLRQVYTICLVSIVVSAVAIGVLLFHLFAR